MAGGPGRPVGLLVAVLVAAAAAWPADAEAQRRGAAADTWVSFWGGVFMDPGTVRDSQDGVETRWDFGTSFSAGAGVQRLFGDALVAGIEVGYAPMRHQVLDGTTGAVLDEGRAHVITPMLSGRLGGGGGGFGTYLSGGAGAMIYGIPHLDRWDPDLALRGGGGIDYRYSATTTFFLEWSRWWVFHQAEGVDDNTVNHSSLRLGLRLGR